MNVDPKLKMSSFFLRKNQDLTADMVQYIQDVQLLWEIYSYMEQEQLTAFLLNMRLG